LKIYNPDPADGVCFAQYLTLKLLAVARRPWKQGEQLGADFPSGS